MAETQYRLGKRKGFTVVYKSVAQDSRLSLKARGLFLFMMSLPDDWNFNIPGLVRQTGAGVRQIRAALAELENVGYLVREQSHSENGTFGGNVWVLQKDAPQPSLQNVTTVEPENQPSLRKAPTEKAPTDNVTLQNTNQHNTPLTPQGETVRVCDSDSQPGNNADATADSVSDGANADATAACVSDAANADASADSVSDAANADASADNAADAANADASADNAADADSGGDNADVDSNADAAANPDAATRRAVTSRCARPRSAPKWKPERFERFWNFYSAHACGKNRQGAVKAWDKLRADDNLINKMALALSAQVQSDMWRRGVGVPYASTWLNNRRWEDAPDNVPNHAPQEREEVSGWIT